MKKIIAIIITLAFIVSGCHTLFMYDTPTGSTTYTHKIIVDTYYPYYYSYPYYWYQPHYNSYYGNKHYAKPHKTYIEPKHNNSGTKYRSTRSPNKVDVRNNTGNRNNTDNRHQDNRKK